MITQKGLKVEDVFALFSEDGTEVFLFIGIPDCEKFSISKSYATEAEAHQSIGRDIQEFIESHKSTLFTLEVEHDVFTGEKTEEPVNDSWGSIYQDAKEGAKDKFKNATEGAKDTLKNRFNFF